MIAGNQRKLLKAWGIPILILIVWQILAQTGVIPTQILSTPSAVFDAGLKMIANGKLWQHIAISTQRALIGLLIGGSLGFADAQPQAPERRRGAGILACLVPAAKNTCPTYRM